MFKLDAYKLKWLAIIGMIANHIVFALWEILPMWLAFPLYAAGGLTFPIMGYFVVEGYRHTRSVGKYVLRLLIFGAIAIPFHYLTFRAFGLNIMFTIMLSVAALILNDKMKIRPLFWLVFILLLVASVVFMADWMIIGPIVVLLYHKIKNENVRRIVPAVVSGVFWLLLILFSMVGLAQMQALGIEDQMGGPTLMTDMNFLKVSLTFIIGCLIAAFLIKGYNGERGRKMKWTFYAFYPIHLAVLGITSVALGLFTI